MPIILYNDKNLHYSVVNKLKISCVCNSLNTSVLLYVSSLFHHLMAMNFTSTVCLCFNLNVNLIDMAFKSVTLRWAEHKSQKRETKQSNRVLMR